jgi:hypothetical protein
MAVVWADPRTAQQMLTLHEVTTRLLIETDPETLDALIEQLMQLIRAERLTRLPN